jgi:hypothetical protein
MSGPRGEPPRGEPPVGPTLAQARAASLVVDVQTKRLALEQRRSGLISRDLATLKTLAFARRLVDALLAFPVRIGPQLAATFERDAVAMTAYLDEQIRQLVAETRSRAMRFLRIGAGVYSLGFLLPLGNDHRCHGS